MTESISSLAVEPMTVEVGADVRTDLAESVRSARRPERILAEFNLARERCLAGDLVQEDRCRLVGDFGLGRGPLAQPPRRAASATVISPETTERTSLNLSSIQITAGRAIDQLLQLRSPN